MKGRDGSRPDAGARPMALGEHGRRRIERRLADAHGRPPAVGNYGALTHDAGPSRMPLVARLPARCAPRGRARDPGGRRAIGEAARQRALEEHTYLHRGRTLFSDLSKPAYP